MRPRAVEFVAEQLIGRAGGQTEPAVHALAQHGVGGRPLNGGEQAIGQARLHGLSVGVEAPAVEHTERVEHVEQAPVQVQADGVERVHGRT